MQKDTITKKDLDDALNRHFSRTQSYIDEKIEVLREEQRDYRNENMTRLDEVMGELQNIREDNVIGTYQIRNLQETVDDHETRIKNLEAPKS